MILDHLTNADLYLGLGGGIAEALRFLRETDLGALPPGRREIDGRRLFALVQHYQTKAPGDENWEAHRAYIDVQYVVEGVERIGHAALGRLRPGAYDAERDYLSLSGQGDFLLVPAGTFAVFWPNDAHQPGLLVTAAPAPVQKIVVKVRIAP